MTLLVRLIAAAATALTLAVLPDLRVAACSCAMSTPEQAAAAADAVFVGSVEAAELTGTSDQFGEQRVTYTFAVEGVVKGAVGERTPVIGGDELSGGSCGQAFAHGQRYVVFASYDGPMLTTNLCSGSAQLEPGQEPPLPVSGGPFEMPDEPEPSSVPIPLLVSIGVAAVIAVASMIAFRRPRGGKV